MGSMIYLTIGHLEIDWGKNNFFNDHSALFRRSDIQRIPYRYVDDDGAPLIEMKEGYSCSLGTVLKRLSLLGYSAEGAKRAFERSLAEEAIETPPITFEALATALAAVDATNVNPDYNDDYDPGQFFSREIYDRLELDRFVEDKRAARYDLDTFMENFEPYWLLCLMAENPANHALTVNWGFSDVAENYTGRDIFLHNLEPGSKFLIVTEGSSDGRLLAKALALLRPEVADFFSFVDMEEGYPFSGAGNLYRFCQGLVSIGIQNQVLVIYDNDAEGRARHGDTGKLLLPSNMRVMRLPSLRDFERFSTVGPNGPSLDDINGRAAAVECYLDLRWRMTDEPKVRWTSYNKSLGLYQGELINKAIYARQFLDLRQREEDYKFTKLEALLDTIIGECSIIAARRFEEPAHPGR